MTPGELAQLVIREGITLETGDGDQAEALIVIAKLRSMSDGEISLAIASSPGMDPITQLGIVTAAHDICLRGPESGWEPSGGPP